MIPEKSLREILDLGILWGSEFVEVCDEVDVMCVQIVIELYMLCKVYKEDEMCRLWAQSCRFCKKREKMQKNVKKRKKRQKIAKNVKNAKNPYKPLFFVLFSKTRNFIRDLHGDFSPKTRFFHFLA